MSRRDITERHDDHEEELRAEDFTEPRRTAPLNATMPPCSEKDVQPTEDAIDSAVPVCDRGTLTMVNGGHIGAVYRLGSVTVLGRSFECDVRINDMGVSRRHARITQESETRYVVQDLGSRNGTSIRGRAVTREALSDGDRLGIGPIVFRFALTDEAEEVALKRRYESSIIDGLTGAINRRHFDHRLVVELAFAKRHDVDVSLLLIDIDHFKDVNDHFGHTAGDAALRRFSETIHRTLRAEDIFARYGGEEFAIVARGIGGRDALAFGERIRKLIENTPFEHGDHPGGLTVSIGVSSLRDCRDASVDELIALADRRLYVAKSAGRNRCHAG